jgi:hypothetical protein
MAGFPQCQLGLAVKSVRRKSACAKKPDTDSASLYTGTVGRKAEVPTLEMTTLLYPLDYAYYRTRYSPPGINLPSVGLPAPHSYDRPVRLARRPGPTYVDHY